MAGSIPVRSTNTQLWGAVVSTHLIGKRTARASARFESGQVRIMTAEEKLDKIKAYIRQYVDEEFEREEFFDPQDMFGGNFDDAYNGGVRDGMTELANDINAFINES